MKSVFKKVKSTVINWLAHVVGPRQIFLFNWRGLKRPLNIGYRVLQDRRGEVSETDPWLEDTAVRLRQTMAWE
jgi:hypothetical protein